MAEIAEFYRSARSTDDSVAGQVRAGLVRDWQVLAGTQLARRVDGAWDLLRASHHDWPPLHGLAGAGWIPTSAWLALHRLLIEHGWQGDSLGFARDWHELVLARVGRPAQWALRAYGLPRAILRVPEVWPQIYPGPAPEASLQNAQLQLDFADHPLLDQPLARLLLACQARLGAELFTGRAQVLRQECGPATWALKIGPRNDS